jgi:hypothetical protein
MVLDVTELLNKDPKFPEEQIGVFIQHAINYLFRKVNRKVEVVDIEEIPLVQLDSEQPAEIKLEFGEQLKFKESLK